MMQRIKSLSGIGLTAPAVQAVSAITATLRLTVEGFLVDRGEYLLQGGLDRRNRG